MRCWWHRFELQAERGLPGDTFLASNYLSGIGLLMLLEKAWDVAQQAA